MRPTEKNYAEKKRFTPRGEEETTNAGGWRGRSYKRGVGKEMR